MKHSLFISFGSEEKDFNKALRFSDRVVEVFGSAIKMSSTGMQDKEFGSFISFNDVRCIPAVFDLAKIFA